VTGPFEVEIEYLDTSGDGIAHTGDRFVSVPFTIPGERVRVAITPRRQLPSSAIPARLLDVLRPSPHRVTPGCLHFGDATPDRGGCGTCSWQHIAYPEQLRLKTVLVQRLLHEALRSAPPVKPTRPGVPAEPWGYRHKAHFVFANEAAAGRHPGPLVMGHYARGSRRVVPVVECPVHDRRGNDAAFRFRDAFRRAGVIAEGGGPGVSSGALRSIAVRTAYGSQEVMATLVVADDGDNRLRSATRRHMAAAHLGAGVHLNIHPRGDAFIFGRETRCLSGPARLREEVAGASFLISPTTFFQTNVYAAEVLAGLVLEAIPAGDEVLDLYAGAGLFAIPLARRGHRVVAVEENRAAVADGEVSARLNRITAEQCRFIVRPVESALASFRRAGSVIVDPPRDGCAAAVIDDILGRLAPQRLIYVSCNPEALARDLRRASAFPYAIRSVQPVDMFPHTAHVETVAILVRDRQATAPDSPRTAGRRR
jgi:23S rRNA (uracil1939-C5)-methyltransferase